MEIVRDGASRFGSQGKYGELYEVNIKDADARACVVRV